MRHLLEFATTFDPMRTARLEVSQTLRMLGWPHNEEETITDDVKVDFSMKETYCAFCVVDPANTVQPGHPNASSTPAMPLLRRGPDGSILMPRQTPYPDAPAPWLNPAQGLMLDRTTAERHAFIRSKGWALVAIPLQLWRAARASPRQHYARRDVITGLTLPLAPFQTRPIALQAEAQSKSLAPIDVSGTAGAGTLSSSGTIENNRGRIRSRTRRIAADSAAAGTTAAADMKAVDRARRKEAKVAAAKKTAAAIDTEKVE
jgi:hypothetical protein